MEYCQKNVVLPHEDQEEFDNLLSALRAEHRPSGGTAECLVEELAGIMWRKRRVLLAEGARIKGGFGRVSWYLKAGQAIR